MRRVGIDGALFRCDDDWSIARFYRLTPCPACVRRRRLVIARGSTAAPCQLQYRFVRREGCTADEAQAGLLTQLNQLFSYANAMGLDDRLGRGSGAVVPIASRGVGCGGASAVASC